MTATNNTHTSSIDLSWLEPYRHITVIGLGMSGMGVVRRLAQQGIALHVQDSREMPDGLNELTTLGNVQSVHTGSFHLETILASDLLIMSPGVSLQTPEIQQAMAAGIEISSDVDIVTRSSAIPIIGITGSNGKSTVTQLTGELCIAAGYKTFIGGNIGRSVMELLDDSFGYELAVLELSSFQLEITPKLNAFSATVLNLSPDHLDRYTSYQEYATSKLAVYTNSQYRIWNRDDQWLQSVELFSARSTNSDKLLSFGLQAPQDSSEYGILIEDGDSYFARGQDKVCPTRSSQLIGRHNHLNVLAALALLDSFAIDSKVIDSVLQQFQGLAHRMQKVRELNGVRWVNDSKATNVGATQSALEGLQCPTVLIAGGQGKGADFTELLPYLKRHVKRVYIFGEDAEQMQAAWNQDIDVLKVDNLDAAVVDANNYAVAGDTVLLAPACASFDMFPGFAARGERFMQLVNAL